MRRAFAVSVYILSGRDVLLIKHKRLGLWLPVGGEIEPGETPIEAARREVEEETRLSISFVPARSCRDVIEGEPLGLLGYEEHACGSKGLHMCFSFVARTAMREVVGDGSFTEHRWHDVADIVFPGDTTDSVRQLVHRIHREVIS